MKYAYDSFMTFFIYVDDVIITETLVSNITIINNALHLKFSTKNLRFLKYFLGFEVDRSPDDTLLSQTKDVGMLHCKPPPFPLPKGLHLSPDFGQALNKPDVYRRLIGRLLYANLTRPDINYVVQHLCQFMHTPR